MRISDWSSDVCSSDLSGDHVLRPRRRKGGCTLFVAEERGAMAFPELGGNGAASGSTGRRVARQWAAARRHSDARFGKSPGILHRGPRHHGRSEEHTSELQSLMRNTDAVLCLKRKTTNPKPNQH